MVDSVEVPGLEQPAEILIDKWGVPHIYAASQSDAFVAQGFNAARDRLFHIDLWRRRGLGQLSEVFGSAHVERDRAARLFLYRGDMRAEWLAYGSDTKQVATAFVTGINAFVALALRKDTYMPIEFKELGYHPSFWEPWDVARIRSHGLFYNLEQEVERALTLRDYNADVENLRRPREPQHELRIPEGLDLSIIPDDVLDVYRLATTPPDLSGSFDRPTRRDEPQGSNNWVIGKSRTATGRPLLANDPHRVVSLPGLRYIAHLVAPGLDVIGAGEPALPGISIGHNGRVAFGLTIFAIDQEDLYVYRTNPDNPREYLYKGRWTPMEEVTERISVRGGESVDVLLLFTRHGPVIYRDEEKQTAFSVRAAWLEAGMAPYLGSMEYMRAQSPAEFVTAMNRWGAPGENQLYASPDGTIGWKPGGLVPVRPNWDGTIPVPGDGRYEWDGFYDGDQLPSEHMPTPDWFATANEMNLPEDYPNESRTISYDWYSNIRYARIAEVLGARSDWTVEDCVALQTDCLSIPAREIVKLLQNLTGLSDGPRRAVDLLRNWDCRLTVDSGAAAFFEVWYRRHLRPALYDKALTPLVADEQREAVLQHVLPDEDMAADCRVDLDLLLNPRQGLGQNPEEAISRILRDSLFPAIVEVEELLGADWSDWSWGRLHQAHLKHPQAAILGPRHEEWTSVGPVSRAGSGDTVGATAYSKDFVQTVGASFRIVVDVGDWDNSVAMNTPGQSGVPGSPHFKDLFSAWAEGGSFPLLYSRELVEQNLSMALTLKPENTESSTQQ